MALFSRGTRPTKSLRQILRAAFLCCAWPGIMMAAITILIVFCLFPPSLALAASGPMTFSVEVPPGKWKTLRLKNLPKDVSVLFAVKSDGPLSVGFLDGVDHCLFPQVRHPLFWGLVEAKLGFSVTIQQKGDYYVVLDNREGSAARQVTLTADAAMGEAAARAAAAERLRAVEQQLKTMQQKLGQAFIFDPFTVQVKACEANKPFVRSTNLTLCLEYARQLVATLQDRTQASDALVYSMFFEMAQRLQTQWNLPLSSHRDGLDELTTTLMLTFRLDAQVRSYAQTLINNPTIIDHVHDVFHDPDHALSVERAPRVLQWATDPDLVRKWQPTLVPHMQSSMLRHLRNHPQPWSDATLVEKELASHDQTSTGRKLRL